ncbi:hypothetical protein DPMN_011679 [Dreissena polymorpha]|uniref:Uncharacterized protein n=1 Tax=Dreissena polymorpha TaxID=45954 RepID=A0A9D4N440_DREPO|nr:hypothetical protein DPMN_011679 [Dreissena polymorpha]
MRLVSKDNHCPYFLWCDLQLDQSPMCWCSLICGTSQTDLQTQSVVASHRNLARMCRCSLNHLFKK